MISSCIQPIRLFLLCLFVVLLLLGHARAQSQVRPLTADEKRGKALYLRGESSSGQEITAVLNDLDVPASTLTCAGCHGARGEGRTEGGVTAGNLVWSNLNKSYGHTHDIGRKHNAFTEASFVRALTGGVDPAGNKLAVAMPAYRMPQQDMADLIAYLKRIDTDLDPGISDDKIVIGTLLPEKNALTGLAQSMEDVLRAYFAEVNARGGIFNRKVELHVLNGSAGATVANMRQLIDDSQVFAIVSGLTAGAESEVATLSREREVPFIGPSTLLPDRASPLNRYIFYLLPGLKEQAQSLVNFAAKKSDLQKAQVAIISPDSEFSKGIAASIGEQEKKLGWSSTRNVYYPHDAFKAKECVTELKAKGIDTIFMLGSANEADAFFKEAGAEGWSPTVYLLGTLVGKSAPELVPAEMKDRVFFAFPTVPGDVSEAGAAEYSGLLQRNKLSSAHAAAQASAIAAAKILVYSLERCGKDLTREQLVTTLEGLYEFDTGLMPKITFGPNRRIGALGAYVVTIDPEKKLFPASVEWVPAE
ncbi:MAG TPA: ABC transporter substrate-binding protein [Pyrinomonadaceae bacterium]|jgi:ABC-type branched-subunit amino acid transport system substrate-binding protein|nr:ABC transporter substrate-binding protein [Pyrinomonadaceae bacterium]